MLKKLEEIMYYFDAWEKRLIQQENKLKVLSQKAPNLQKQGSFGENKEITNELKKLHELVSDSFQNQETPVKKNQNPDPNFSFSNEEEYSPAVNKILGTTLKTIEMADEDQSLKLVTLEKKLNMEEKFLESQKRELEEKRQELALKEKELFLLELKLEKTLEALESKQDDLDAMEKDFYEWNESETLKIKQQWDDLKKVEEELSLKKSITATITVDNFAQTDLTEKEISQLLPNLTAQKNVKGLKSLQRFNTLNIEKNPANNSIKSQPNENTFSNGSKLSQDFFTDSVSLKASPRISPRDTSIQLEKLRVEVDSNINKGIFSLSEGKSQLNWFSRCLDQIVEKENILNEQSKINEKKGIEVQQNIKKFENKIQTTITKLKEEKLKQSKKAESVDSVKSVTSNVESPQSPSKKIHKIADILVSPVKKTDVEVQTPIVLLKKLTEKIADENYQKLGSDYCALQQNLQDKVAEIEEIQKILDQEVQKNLILIEEKITLKEETESKLKTVEDKMKSLEAKESVLKQKFKELKKFERSIVQKAANLNQIVLYVNQEMKENKSFQPLSPVLVTVGNSKSDLSNESKTDSIILNDTRVLQKKQHN